MQALTIKELRTFTPGSPVVIARGRIIAVSPYQAGESNGIPWTLQNARLYDDTGEMTVKLCNQADLTQDAVQADFVFQATKKANGQLIGLKMAQDPYMEEGTQKFDLVLEVTRAARVVTAETFALTEAKAIETQKAAIAAQQKQLTKPKPEPQQPTNPVLKQPANQLMNDPASQDLPQSLPAPTQALPSLYVAEIRYERTVNTGNYCSEKLGVTLAVQPGTRAEAAYKTAKKFVDDHLPQEFADPKGRKV